MDRVDVTPPERDVRKAWSREWSVWQPGRRRRCRWEEHRTVVPVAWIRSFV